MSGRWKRPGGIYLIHGRNVRIPTEAYSFCAICCVFTLDYQKKTASNTLNEDNVRLFQHRPRMCDGPKLQQNITVESINDQRRNTPSNVKYPVWLGGIPRNSPPPKIFPRRLAPSKLKTGTYRYS